MSEFWQVVLMKVLDVLIPLLVPALIAAVSAYAASVWKQFKDDQPDIAWNIEKAAHFAVQAAEQLKLSNQIMEIAGKEYDKKMDYAIEVAQKYLDTQGLKNIDLDFLRAAIEAEVLKQFPKAKLPPAE